jgi:hypothetical protein
LKTSAKTNVNGGAITIGHPLHTGTNMDVALDFEGDVLWRVAAGQGGPPTHDILTRVRGAGAGSAQLG